MASPSNQLTVFDPNITRNSPAGSCLLKMLEAAAPYYKLQLFTSRTDLKPSDRVLIHKIPIPARPVFLQNIVFTLLASALYLTQKHGLRVSTQGAFPFCEIAYAHSPHKLFLTRYRHHVAGGFLTRAARLLNYQWIAALEAVAFRRAKVIVVPSQGLAADLSETYGGIICHKLHVISNPVDCKAFAPPANRTPLQQFTFAFCALGNFEWKGLGLVIEAFAQGLDAQLQVIGGNDSEIREFRAKAQFLGVAHQIQFQGMQKDIRPYLWNANAFVFPSTHESFALVCLQAAAAGLPLITTNLYALNKLVQPGISGWIVDRTVPAIHRAMQQALSDPEQTRKMGGQAQQLAQQYDEPTFQNHWLTLLTNLNAPTQRDYP